MGRRNNSSRSKDTANQECCQAIGRDVRIIHHRESLYHRETSMPGVVSMGPEIIRLGIRLQAISLNHSVRILHHLLLHTFGASMRFVHALVPFVFPLQVGTMIQESPSKFFPTASGISGPVTRRTTTFAMASES